MQRATWIACILTAGTALFGCGTTEEVQEPTIPPPPPVRSEEAARMQFESKTDTVDVTQTIRADSVTAASHEPQIRFMVQIGAFKEPHHAVQVQTLARTRYRMPVLNDYDLKMGVYQIRIGFFETRETAMEFRARLQKEYLEDYRDAWVVQLRR